MITSFESLLKNMGFKIESSDIKSLVAFNLESKLVLTIVNKSKCTIAKSTEHDIRFKGNIDNVQQLKMIINSVNKYDS